MSKFFRVLLVTLIVVAIFLANASIVCFGWNVFVDAFQLIPLPKIQYSDALLLFALIGLIKGKGKEDKQYDVESPDLWVRVINVIVNRLLMLGLISIISLFV